MRCYNICRVKSREIRKEKLLVEVGLLKLGPLVAQGFRMEKCHRQKKKTLKEDEGGRSEELRKS